MNHGPRLVCLLLAALALAPTARAADASAPRGTTLTIYDGGFALVSELRSVVLAGDAPVTVKQLPARLDPTTVSFVPTGSGRGLEVLEQRFEYDLRSPEQLFRRYLNRAVSVRGREGRLVSVPAWQQAAAEPLRVALADGSIVTYLSAAQAGEVTFPSAGGAYLEPTLVWQARAAQDGQQNVRLSYVADGLGWRGAYDVVLGDGAAAAQLGARVAVRNDAGGRFQAERVRLVMTEKGRVAAAARLRDAESGEAAGLPGQRYAYGLPEPQPERAVASLAPVATYEVPRPLALEDGDEVFVQMAWTDKLQVRRFYVYDGVRFDRFQRNRRNDWNYGTEYHETVDTHIEFSNTPDNGLGAPLPPGDVHLYQRRADGSVDLLGRDFIAAVGEGKDGTIRVGPARGLRGERERTGYNEVKPLHEYEESFEIRLSSESDETAEVRVVEHLYRWQDYEIVKADAEYTTVAPQTIEFRPELKPGGKRSIHYTVRYRW